MKRFSDVRKIKVNADMVKKNNLFLHPNTLELGKNETDEPFYPTQFFIDNNKLALALPAKNKQLVISKKTSHLMEIPDLSLPLSDILNLYNVNTYDELLELIKKLKFDDKNEFTIYRLVNAYTRLFFNDLKKSNNTLIKIFKIIFDNHKINEDKLSAYIKKWFDKNDQDNFELNICNDIKSFLSNKYESN